jgi:hypothetical protein
MKETNLSAYLSGAIAQMAAEVYQGTFQNPKETSFLIKQQRYQKAAAKLRLSAQRKGEPIPPFLIASIAKH